MRRRLVWLAAILMVFVIAGLILARGRGITSLRAPLPMEAFVARAAWRFLVPRAARAAVNPVPDDPAVLQEALEHWADHCATCHGEDGSGDTSIGRRVYPPVPDMRTARTQRLSDGELFYAIERGMPWTAMPGWSNGTAEGGHDSWALVRFIRHLPVLTEAERTEIERLTPKPPPNDARDREIDEFLSGGAPPSEPKGPDR